MKTVAIIAEYNPFHNGHAYQIQQVKKILPGCAVIAVMSGSLVQRGEFALVSKYNRARAAVMCGIDAVFELPAVYSCAPANLFASAAVGIISMLGADHICFGSETGDLDLLGSAARLSGSAEFKAKLRENIKFSGNKSYPKNFYATFRDLYGEENGRVFNGSNDILAVEYIRSLRKLGSPATPVAIKRTGEDYITSASKIRACVRENNFDALSGFMPAQSFNLLINLIKSGKIADINNITAAIISHIDRLEAGRISQFADITGGFEYKIKKARVFDYPALIKSLESKHVTGSQARRMVLNIFFEITRREQKKAPDFTSLLCANKTGREYLKQIKKSARIKIISKPGAFADNPDFAKNIFIDNIYKLALFNKSGETDAVKEKPVIL